MNDHHPKAKRFVPVIFCALAVLALTAAGYLLFDARDQLTASDDEAEFVSYAATPQARSQAPVDDGDLDDERDDEQPDEVDDPIAWSDVDWSELADDERWEVLQPAEENRQPSRQHDEEDEVDSAIPSSTAQPGSTPAPGQPTGRLIVVTNFSRADVVVNGHAYPSYSSDGQNRGMELVANEMHEVFVEFDGHERLYEVTLAPGEQRLLMVELTGMGDRPAPQTERRRRRARSDDDNDEEEADEEMGRVTVYSRPRGGIYVGNEDTGEQTPGTVEVEAGRHEVQVEYREGEMSETKTVRVREGSRVKLFFREDD